MADKVCVVCGTPFHANAHNQLTCSYKCSKISYHNTEKERRKIAREEREKADKIKQNVCDEFCDGCIYKTTLVHVPRCCNYFIATGRRRPCPAGTGCTVKETGKRRHKWREEDDATWKKRVAAHEKKKQEEARARKAKKEKPVLVITCVICGKQFATTDGRRKCCSQECTEESRKWAYRRYDKKRRRENEKQAKSAAGIVSSEVGSAAQAKAGNPDGN